MSDSSSVTSLLVELRGELERYPAGGKLPSSRELVHRHRVSPVTVSRAIAALTAEGLVIARPGAGVFRAPPRRAPASAGDVSWQEVALSAGADARTIDAVGVLACCTDPPPEVIDLNGGYPHPVLQPERALAAALAHAGRRPGAWTRPPLHGLPELRTWFARDIAGPGGTLTAEHVLITSGGQSALTTALRALAVPGAPVLVESPTYPGLLAIARASGLRPVPVPVDADGVRPGLLADAFRDTGARVFVCQPTFQNPTGAVLSAARRLDVLRIAREAGAFVVEDDFARLLAHPGSPAPPPPLAAADPDGVVVHIRSLTKPTSPSLRISALTARGPALERLRGLHTVESFFVPRPLQETALELVSAPAWPRHLRTLTTALRDRRDATIAALREHLPGLPAPDVPHGGYHLWLPLPDGADEASLVSAALHGGVAITPGKLYFAAEPPGPHLRLSYVSAGTVGEVAEGVRRLARACPVSWR
ncbi:aminotransferase-like domain-containing protein [Amycolatopsis sp. H20-H5]|uniref:aminotransferase-like domain-containing protein n=1 Tax=Amycolatopsis sp. H20-H5 TaxID=3046309 RepID=UPI002DBD48F3|nr:PLP-dependent aminotransferase family protein [Amycolatopsis sp. H20-H5]MEC3979289.1 PLP-dependent aminotransferase family protein [Amycolatopsis sp. H20-H5]